MKKTLIIFLKILILIIIIGWVAIVVFDYFKVKSGNDAVFCLKEEVRVYNSSKELEKIMTMKEFNDLSDSVKNEMSYTKQCIGLGYKVYYYHREFNAIEFGPFFIPERQNFNP